MDFGFQLKNIRKQKNYTQDELVAEMNRRYKTKLTKSTLSRYENNRQQPSAETIGQIAEILGVSPGTLMNTKEKSADLSILIQELEETLVTSQGLNLHGEPVSREDVEKIITAMRIGMELIHRENKKYTPRKYREESE